MIYGLAKVFGIARHCCNHTTKRIWGSHSLFTFGWQPWVLRSRQQWLGPTVQDTSYDWSTANSVCTWGCILCGWASYPRWGSESIQGEVWCIFSNLQPTETYQACVLMGCTQWSKNGCFARIQNLCWTKFTRASNVLTTKLHTVPLGTFDWQVYYMYIAYIQSCIYGEKNMDGQLVHRCADGTCCKVPWTWFV